MQTIAVNERIIFALDFAKPGEAISWVERIDDQVKFFKVGLQLFLAGGWPVVDQIVARGNQVMLDLKLYDIPATVELAVSQFADRGITFTTVHGYGPVVKAALAAGSGVRILAVTVLTSMGSEELSELNYQGTVEELVMERAKKVLSLGCNGIVCSAREAFTLRREFGNQFAMVTPGIRPLDADANDQQRIATPAQAILDGADHLVIGRPIRDAENPSVTIDAIQQEISMALGQKLEVGS
jgi:orotidine-5'-phosphate decarboxylase